MLNQTFNANSNQQSFNQTNEKNAQTNLLDALLNAQNLTDSMAIDTLLSYNINAASLAGFVDRIAIMAKKTIIRKKYANKIKTRTREDGKTRYYVRVNRTKQLTARTEEELWDKIFEFETAGDVSNYTMADLFPLWLIWKRDNTPTDIKTLQIHKQKWDKYFEGRDITKKPLKDITPNDLIKLYNKWTCKREIDSKLFANLKSIINGIYKYAASELEIVKYNPSKMIDMSQFPMKVKCKKEKTYKVDDTDKLIQYIRDNQYDDTYALAILFALKMTIRFGELAALKWDDIDGDIINICKFQTRCVEMNDDLTFVNCGKKDTDHVKGYSEDGVRFLHLTPDALALLEHVRELNPDGEYIFLFEGRQLSVNTLNNRINDYCKEIGINYHSSHGLRFFVASHLHQNGATEEELQGCLGHTDISMTQHYLRNVKSNKHLYDLMDKLF